MINCKTPIRKPKTQQALSLPDKLTEILPFIESFNRTSRNDRLQTDWHCLCHESGGFERWHNQQFYPARYNAVEFSALAARAYQALAELDLSQIPLFAPFSVRDVAKWADQSKSILPRNIPLPGAANHAQFRQALADLQRWKPSDLPKGTTGHGDPVRRWLINRLLEEFCYSFALTPSTSAVKDVVCLVWANVDSKTIRYVMNSETLQDAEIKASVRRDFDNKAKTVTQQTINRFSVHAKKSSINPKVTPQSDYEILKALEQLLGSLSNKQTSARILSIVKAEQDEIGVTQDDQEDNWTYS